ncbi:YoaK family protein [Novosphingobium arvoryzae]|uniref:DUF1275 domain-containing protein n=1 Tax=Novosphingobium arvoryzae TaxID=1256514 RepID=A0A918R4Z5_9SPHN|nr:YoaK family protein [Novosphingobium arvoryzae]GGZ85975.1 hypothetical protein GCM10011617_00520 [Novosphingobium arvoryzae]
MHQYDHPRRALAIALAGLAGYVDAAGFLSADRYFVSFMSGNTTRLGVDLIQFPALAWIPALLIAGFVLGVIGGALLAARAGQHRKPVVLGTVTLLLAGAATTQALGHTPAMLALLVAAMGALNNTFQRGGEVSVGLTYMTGALVRMSQGLAAWLTGTGGEGWSGWLLLWLGLALGAVLGAVGWLHAPALVLWIAVAWTGTLAFLSRRLKG